MKLFGKIPTTIRPGFWVVAGMIGYFSTQSLMGAIIWAAVIFVSVIVHELGHALAALKMGLRPHIELIAFGGVTRYQGGSLSLGKRFIVVLAGPLFGIFLFLLATFLLSAVSFRNPILFQFLSLLQVVNLFWTAVNLLPILPLDGGQMLRIILEACFGFKGLSYCLLVGFILSLIGGVLFLFLQMFLFGAFLCLFAYQNFTDWQREKENWQGGAKDELQRKFYEAEKELREGSKEIAFEKFHVLISESSKGTVHQLSSQHLAFLKYEKGESLKTYELLLSQRKYLMKDALFLLHKVAFELEDYDLVLELSGECFQTFPLSEVAIKAAKAAAQKQQVKACTGWLESSLELGGERSLDIISNPLFDPVRQDPIFSKWTLSHLS